MTKAELALADGAMDVADRIEALLAVLPADERPLRSRLSICQANLILYAQRNT